MCGSSQGLVFTSSFVNRDVCSTSCRLCAVVVAVSMPPLQDSPLERLQADSPQLSEIALSWDFPGSPVVKTSSSNEEDVGSIPGWGC